LNKPADGDADPAEDQDAVRHAAEFLRSRGVELTYA
jgi:hypothetical protein